MMWNILAAPEFWLGVGVFGIAAFGVSVLPWSEEAQDEIVAFFDALGSALVRRICGLWH